MIDQLERLKKDLFEIFKNEFKRDWGKRGFKVSRAYSKIHDEIDNMIIDLRG